VAKTLYATKWARPDTCTDIAFLWQECEHPTRMIGANWFTWWNMSEARTCCHWSLVPMELAL
jgi:hypothetical protein